jgi:uncharacterized protein (TIGR02246 family)
MKAAVVLAGVFLFQAFMVACTAPDTKVPAINSPSEIRAIEALMEKYVSGYESQDVDSFVDVFTSDAVRMPPNGSVIAGVEQIRAYYEDWFARETLDVMVTPTEIQVAGDWAYAWGTYDAKVTLADDQGTRTDQGKFLNIYKKGSDGQWRFHRNIWNSDLPVL